MLSSALAQTPFALPGIPPVPVTMAWLLQPVADSDSELPSWEDWVHATTGDHNFVYGCRLEDLEWPGASAADFAMLLLPPAGITLPPDCRLPENCGQASMCGSSTAIDCSPVVSQPQEALAPRPFRTKLKNLGEKHNGASPRLLDDGLSSHDEEFDDALAAVSPRVGQAEQAMASRQWPPRGPGATYWCRLPRWQRLGRMIARVPPIFERSFGIALRSGLKLDLCDMRVLASAEGCSWMTVVADQPDRGPALMLDLTTTPCARRWGGDLDAETQHPAAASSSDHASASSSYCTEPSDPSSEEDWVKGLWEALRSR